MSGQLRLFTNRPTRENRGKKFQKSTGSFGRTCLCTKNENWTVHKIFLEHPDVEKHGFQYVDWQFDGRHIIFLSRTAYEDEFGGARNFHDANFLTFHRIKNFRKFQKKVLLREF